MTTQAFPDVESDHKSWLREIESWQNNAPHWIHEQTSMVAEYEDVLRAAREHGGRLREFECCVQSLRDAVMNAERQMIAERREATPSSELLKLHAECSRQHDRLRELHMHLMHTQRSLQAGLASLEHEPGRGT